MTSFGERVRGVLAGQGPLCVGIDPHEALLRDWDLDVSADGCRKFGLRVVDAAVAAGAGIVKPQVSFFERWGAVGYAALEDVLAAGRAAGLVVVADAKRGDIGTTMEAYAQAWLTPGSPLEADALTVSPYLGVGALIPAFDLCRDHDKGLFVLAATSNPEARSMQRGFLDDPSLPERVIADLTPFARFHTPEGEWSPFGVVIGATVDHVDLGIPETFDEPLPILAPGFGAQGAEPEDLVDRFGGLAPYVIASESRSLLAGGADGLAARIAARAAEYREVVGG